MNPLKWWQKAVFYQIYPRSFADGNGDGIGDFVGMTARLDYLQDLGIDAIWLSPHYPSPFLDCGYDISDYCNVAPEYGTLEEFTAFLNGAYARGLRVILDLVLNHTSDQHPWFVESRSNRTNPRRDWYIWRDGKNGGPPNNWASIFGGSSWELDPATGQYYYHAFLKEQPDLNWRNPQVKQGMWEAVRFWLDLGVDGFRLDAVAVLLEHPDLPDHTLALSADDFTNANLLDREKYDQLMQYQIQQPGIHELLKELRALVNEYPGDRVLVGEDELPAYHGSGDDELDLVFNFPLLRTPRITPAHVRANQAQRLAELPPGAWPCNTLGNHDTPRTWSRYGDGAHNDLLARLHLALLLTLKGTPFLFNGEEIGMSDLELTALDQLRDTMVIHRYHNMTQKLHVPTELARLEALADTRDRCRSPFQWNGEPNSGFSPPGVQTWLPVNANYQAGVNAAEEEADSGSLLNFYRRLLHLRRAAPALMGGDYQILEAQNEDCLAFQRSEGETGQTCLVALNFSERKQVAHLGWRQGQARILFSSQERVGQVFSLESLELGPFEVFIAELSKPVRSKIEENRLQGFLSR